MGIMRIYVLIIMSWGEQEQVLRTPIKKSDCTGTVEDAVMQDNTG